MDCTDFYHNHNFDRESHWICAFFFFKNKFFEVYFLLIIRT